MDSQWTVREGTLGVGVYLDSQHVARMMGPFPVQRKNAKRLLAGLETEQALEAVLKADSEEEAIAAFNMCRSALAKVRGQADG